MKGKLKDFVWQKESNMNGYTVIDRTNGNELFVTNRGNGQYSIEGIMTMNPYGQEVPKRFNKFEVMDYMYDKREA